MLFRIHLNDPRLLNCVRKRISIKTLIKIQIIIANNLLNFQSNSLLENCLFMLEKQISKLMSMFQDSASDREQEQCRTAQEPEHASLHTATQCQDPGWWTRSAKARSCPGRQEWLRSQGDDPHVGSGQDQGLSSKNHKSFLILLSYIHI